LIAVGELLVLGEVGVVAVELRGRLEVLREDEAGVVDSVLGLAGSTW
jgi:hypothetical protein